MNIKFSIFLAVCFFTVIKSFAQSPWVLSNGTLTTDGTVTGGVLIGANTVSATYGHKILVNVGGVSISNSGTGSVGSSLTISNPGISFGISTNNNPSTGALWNSLNIKPSLVDGGIYINQSGRVGIGTGNVVYWTTGATYLGRLTTIEYADLSNTQPLTLGNAAFTIGTLDGGLAFDHDQIEAYGDKKLFLNKQSGSNIVMGLGGGKIGVGTELFYSTEAKRSYKMAVKGGIISDEVRVSALGTTEWADYVFDKNYKLTSLEDTKEFIQKNKHLPGVPSAAHVAENGYDIVNMDATLLKKIEELTLYMIQVKEENEKLKHELEILKKAE